MASASTLLGAAGEYYVMSQLLRRGFIAALAPVGVPNADIIVTDDLGDRLCAIQVKSRRDIGADGGWHMRAKHEDICGALLFYVFVDFGRELESTPRCYVIPSQIVANVLRKSHSLYLATAGKSGRKRKDSEMRRLLPDYDRVLNQSIGHGAGWLDQYADAWKSLRTATTTPPE